MERLFFLDEAVLIEGFDGRRIFVAADSPELRLKKGKYKENNLRPDSEVRFRY